MSNQVQSSAIKCNQVQSSAIKCNQAMSNQMQSSDEQSSANKCNQRLETARVEHLANDKERDGSPFGGRHVPDEGGHQGR
jgi:hypothetical protein